jgi:hypothetical protein
MGGSLGERWAAAHGLRFEKPRSRTLLDRMAETKEAGDESPASECTSASDAASPVSTPGAARA